MHPEDQNLVVVAMSGGVDSSLTAALLLEMGYQVIGVMLRLWNEPGQDAHNRCCTPDAMANARRVAALLEIPFYALDVKELFKSQVVQYFIDGYAQGITPNPCLACNRHIRWSFLLSYARALGADHLATGHYARIHKDEDGRFQLLRGIDRIKDQSYILHFLGQDLLSHTILPLGGYSKADVRQMARERHLPVSERADSQDLCFLGERDYRHFLQRNAPHVHNTGHIINQEGQIIGKHNGLACFTIGQRKGIRISSPIPLYVLEKDVDKNVIIVGERHHLGKRRLIAGSVNWISGSVPVKEFRAQVKIRSTASLEQAVIQPADNEMVEVTFDRQQRDITPGQAVVFYNREVCLGGGVILEAE